MYFNIQEGYTEGGDLDVLGRVVNILVLKVKEKRGSAMDP